MSLYIGRGADGVVTAFLRDPLYNLGRRFNTMKLSVARNKLVFSNRGFALAGTIDDPNTITLELPQSGLAPIVFSRRTSDEAPADTTYRVPLPTGDGWAIGAAPDAGLAVASLEDLARFAAGATPTAVSSPAVQGISIARYGKLVFDDYFGGFGEATLHDTRSAGKTYADVLAGAAIEAGVPMAGDTLVLPLFARYGALVNPDPRKGRITLGDALSMSTGLDCDDNDEHSVANEDNEQSQSAQPDWDRLVLDARMVRDPGTKAVYCSASINLAGGAIASATHSWLPTYFARHIAEPLQMQRYALNLTPTGDWYLGGGAYVRPRDFLKIGQLFLDGGLWHGSRILPRSWIDRSWSARLTLGAGDGYGYAWHVRSYLVDGTTYPAYEAQGNGGQILDVLPKLDLAVMISQGNYNNFATWGPTRDAIVTRIIEATQTQ
jgi:CubicO group peptidase (beta-lactamase class C family)